MCECVCVRINNNKARTIQLTTDVLRVADPDSSPAELIFSSLGNSSEGGHLENQDSPSRFVLWQSSIMQQTINLKLAFMTDEQLMDPKALTLVTFLHVLQSHSHVLPQ